VPALVPRFSPIRDDPGPDAAPVALLRVGLDEHGAKIGKKMLGPVAGAAIKIDPDDAVELGLGICEGLETGLAIRVAGWRPVWCLGSAGAIRTFPVLSGIEAITVFADNDANVVGIEAARECARRWAAAGLEASIRTPREIGADWADAT
jgi:putative DNA primase/helicase